jgi:TRAP-type transport system periplasmic protein
MSFRTIASVIAIMTACSFAAGPTAAQQIKLTFADQNSPTAWGPTRALYPWVKQLEEATKGRIKVEVYPSQTLVKGVDMWKAASAGTIDIGWCVQSYWSDLTPLSDVVSLPGLPAGVSAEKLSEVLWKLYEKYPAIQKEYDSANVQPLALYTTASYFIASARKQVKTLEDMQGLKIRTVGGPAVDFIKAAGGVPTPMPAPDIYQALDKGVVDAAAVPWEAIHGFRLYEVVNSVTLAPLSRAYFSICANKAKIQSLPAEVRSQIMSVGGIAGSKFWGKSFFDTAEAGVADALTATGKNLVRIELPPAELQRWTKLAAPIHEDWVKRMEAKGHKEAREILDTMLAMLKS